MPQRLRVRVPRLALFAALLAGGPVPAQGAAAAEAVAAGVGTEPASGQPALCPPAEKAAPARKAAKKRARGKARAAATAGAVGAAPATASGASATPAPDAFCPPCAGDYGQGAFEALTFDPDFDTVPALPIAWGYGPPWVEPAGYLLPRDYRGGGAVWPAAPAYDRPALHYGPDHGRTVPSWPEYRWPDYRWPDYRWPEYSWPDPGWPQHGWPGYGYPPRHGAGDFPLRALNPAWYGAHAPGHAPWIDRIAPPGAWDDGLRWRNPGESGYGHYRSPPFGWW